MLSSDGNIFHENPDISINLYPWFSDLAEKKNASIPPGQVSVQCCDFEGNTWNSRHILSERSQLLDWSGQISGDVHPEWSQSTGARPPDHHNQAVLSLSLDQVGPFQYQEISLLHDKTDSGAKIKMSEFC